jgi:hypothetical protein
MSHHKTYIIRVNETHASDKWVLGGGNGYSGKRREIPCLEG